MKLGGGNYLKVSDVSSGDQIVFKSEGEWVQNARYTYDDGSPKKDFVMKVEYDGGEKLMRMNKTNRDAMIAAYGDDTVAWIGKTATITVEKALVGGKKFDVIMLEADDVSGEAASAPALPF